MFVHRSVPIQPHYLYQRQRLFQILQYILAILNCKLEQYFKALYTYATDSPKGMIFEDHSTPYYYCDEVDLCWLEAVNKQKKLRGLLEVLQNF